MRRSWRETFKGAGQVDDFAGMPATDEPVQRPRGAGRMIAALAALLGAVVLAGSMAASAGAAEAGLALPGPNVVRPADLKALGTHWVRMFAPWPDLEFSRGVYNEGWLNAYEQSFKTLPPGTKVLLDVVDSPEWETGSTDEHMPPANPEDYAAMLNFIAHRFAGHVDAYEIWNEEDAPIWWTGAPDPAAYTRLLQAAYPAIKAADPSATVLVGGLTGNDYSFLEDLYADGAKGYFDAVGVHTDTACDILPPYTFLRGTDNRILPDSFLGYREVHAVMVANGDDKPIWMTEMSWRTTTATCSEGAWAGQKAEGVSEEQQATNLAEAYHCLDEDPYVKVGLWFPLQDEAGVSSGLMQADGAHKPSYGAMKAYAHNGDSLSEPCGVFTGPRISIASPSNNYSYSGPLPIRVSASSSVGVFRIRLEIDGKLIRNYDGDSYPDSLTGAIEWQGAKHIPLGRHTLTFLAYDKERNVSEASITIIHTAAGADHGGRGASSGSAGRAGRRSKAGKRHARRHARKHAARRRKHA